MVWIASQSQAHPTYLQHQQMLVKRPKQYKATNDTRHMHHMLERVSRQRKP